MEEFNTSKPKSPESINVFDKLVEEFKNIPIGSPESKTAFEKIVGILSKEAYKEIAQKYSEHFGKNWQDIYWQPACFQYQGIIHEKLQELGLWVENVQSDIRHLVPNGKPHYFLELNKYQFIIDGTWQQYLAGDEINQFKDEKYHCLILNTETLVKDLQKMHVPERLWSIYIKRTPTKPGMRRNNY